jgi:hypothetical protein
MADERTDPVPPALVPSAVGGPDAGRPDVETAGGADRATSMTSRLRDMSRRRFLRTGSIGVVAAGVVGSVPGLSSLLGSAESDAPALGGSAAEVQGSASAVEADSSAAAQSFSARVSNVSTGEMRLFVGNQTLHIQDTELAQRLSQAARAAQAAGH